MKNQIISAEIRTDITAIHVEKNFIFAGTGNFLFITEIGARNHLRRAITVFENETIFNIEFSSEGNKFLVSGSNALAVFKFEHSEGICERLTANFYCSDWIVAAKWINASNCLCLVTMHNKVFVLDEKLREIETRICKERCISYTAKVVNSKWSDLLILSGTVFGQVLIWFPSSSISKDQLCPVLIRLEGHQGVLFCIDYHPTRGIICSSSDDRCTKVWEVRKNDFSTGLLTTETAKLKHTLYGHCSRIFRCKILDDFIITAGEDSVINVWNSLGDNVRKFKTQEGNSLWAMGYSKEKNLLVVGGSDGGVTSFILKSNTQCECLKNDDGEDEIPLKLKLMASYNLVVFFENGSLKYYDVRKKKWKHINNHHDLTKYILMNVSKCRKFLSLCGYNGNIHIYEEVEGDLCYKLFHEMPDKGRIYSFNWLTPNVFFCCSKYGTLSMWKMTNNSASIISIFKLPKIQERCSTSVEFFDNKYLAVGDRKGNLYLYMLNRYYPIQILRKVHNHMGIMDISYHETKLLTVGGNGMVRSYNLTTTNNTNQKKLSPTSWDKLPLSCLERIFHVEDDFVLILSFRGDTFTVWDQKTRSPILEIKCGGKHRSWDFEMSTDSLLFCFIKNKSIFLNKSPKSSHISTEIVGYFHTKEINACKIIVFERSKTSSYYVLVTGGEDTTLRISVGQFNDNDEDDNSSSVFRTVQTLKSHLSSIRCIRLVEITKSDKENNTTMKEFIIFSGGGRSQINMWNLKVFLKNDDDNVEVQCKQLHSFYDNYLPESRSSETRIMDMETVVRKDGPLFLIAATSDGTLLVFQILDNNKIKLVRRALNRFVKCITKLGYCGAFSGASEDYEMLACSFTSGKVAFVDLKTIIPISADDQKENTFIFYDPFLTLESHQSAINSKIFKKLDGNHAVLVTGGDDNAVNWYHLEFSKKKDDETICAEVLGKFSDSLAHCAQITGLYLFGNHLITTSVDQRLVLSKIINLDSGGNNIKFETIHCMNVSIPDIQGMQFHVHNQTGYVICFGRGLQLFKINLIKFI